LCAVPGPSRGSVIGQQLLELLLAGEDDRTLFYGHAFLAHGKWDANVNEFRVETADNLDSLCFSELTLGKLA
jgi:hypothetical protein